MGLLVYECCTSWAGGARHGANTVLMFCFSPGTALPSELHCHSPITTASYRSRDPWGRVSREDIRNPEVSYSSPSGRSSLTGQDFIPWECPLGTWEGTVTNCSEANFAPRFLRRINLMSFSEHSRPHLTQTMYLLSGISSCARRMPGNFKKVLWYSTHRR